MTVPSLQPLCVGLHLVVFLVLWYTVHGIFFPFPTNIILSVVFSIVHLTAVIVYLYAGVIQIGDGALALDSKQPLTHDQKRCEFCGGIAHVTSTHCTRCNLCVPYRNHHSLLLNRCVGATNIATYHGLLVVLLSLLLYQSGIGFYLFAQSIQNRDTMDMDIARFHNNTGAPDVYRAFVIFFAVYQGIVLAPLLFWEWMQTCTSQRVREYRRNSPLGAGSIVPAGGNPVEPLRDGLPGPQYSSPEVSVVEVNRHSHAADHPNPSHPSDLQLRSP